MKNNNGIDRSISIDPGGTPLCSMLFFSSVSAPWSPASPPSPPSPRSAAAAAAGGSSEAAGEPAGWPSDRRVVGRDLGGCVLLCSLRTVGHAIVTVIEAYDVPSGTISELYVHQGELHVANCSRNAAGTLLGMTTVVEAPAEPRPPQPPRVQPVARAGGGEETPGRLRSSTADSFSSMTTDSNEEEEEEEGEEGENDAEHGEGKGKGNTRRPRSLSRISSSSSSSSFSSDNSSASASSKDGKGYIYKSHLILLFTETPSWVTFAYPNGPN